MLILVVFVFISNFVITEASGTEFAIIKQMQKFNPQKCMNCPEFNVTQICGFIDDSNAVAFLVNEKKPVPCGKQYINYHTYWFKETCAKAIIPCSTDQYNNTYVYGEKLLNKTSTNNGTKIYPMSFLDFGLDHALGTFICNKNGQWEHVREDYLTPLMKRKRVPVKENISCLFSNYMMADSIPQHYFEETNDTKKMKPLNSSSSC